MPILVPISDQGILLCFGEVQTANSPKICQALEHDRVANLGVPLRGSKLNLFRFHRNVGFEFVCDNLQNLNSLLRQNFSMLPAVLDCFG